MDTATKGPNADQYQTFADLAAQVRRDVDYRITTIPRTRSSIAVIAPHGGSIERRTSAITKALAGDEFNYYLFEGLDPAGSFESLHITSHRFDEPNCLQLIASSDHVIAVHGCSESDERVMLGGLDHELIDFIAQALQPIAIEVQTDDHPYPGRHRQNICNRGRRGVGVQLELSDGLRGGANEAAVIAAIRGVLLQLDR